MPYLDRIPTDKGDNTNVSAELADLRMRSCLQQEVYFDWRQRAGPLLPVHVWIGCPDKSLFLRWDFFLA